MTGAASVAWPAERLPEALQLLASRSGLRPRAAALAVPRDGAAGAWIEGAAEWLGLEAEPADAGYADLEGMIRSAAPALVRLGEGGYVLLLRRGRRAVSAIAPDLAVRRLSVEHLRRAMCAAVEAPVLPEVDELLRRASVSGRDREKARAGLLRQRLGQTRIGGCWLLRPTPHAPATALAARIGLWRRLSALAALHAAAHLLWLLSWWLLGWSVLEDRLDAGWLLAWALLRVTLIPVQLIVTWTGGCLAIEAGTLLRQRLLAGGLRLDPEVIRREGVGQLLGRVIESEAVEQLAASGGLPALLALVELAAAFVVLALGAGGALQAVLLAGWIAIGAALAARLVRARARWTDRRLDLAHEMVEKMVGHRTRLAQQPTEQRHEGEDDLLGHYLARSRAMDRAALLFGGLVPRGWLVLGTLGLAPAFVGSADAGSLAVGVAGVLLAFQALHRMSEGILEISGALVSWRKIAPLLGATEPAPRTAPLGDGGEAGPAVLEARSLAFGHARRERPVLRSCDLRVAPGDRVLLTGPSGAGKSTLASILAGLRTPRSGLLLLSGLDPSAFPGDAWRRRVVLVPQFHENHVLAGTLAFNLLLGRSWPPAPQDLADAEATCRGLGLQPLLDRMPAGLQQTVGETGWQLSHGERTRLYLARALLQRPDVVLLDESFAAIDPLTLEGVVRFVAERAPALVVMEHR